MRPVAFDIETTGFTIDDAVTSIGFELPLGAAMFLNSGGRRVDADRLETTCAERAGRQIKLSVAETETGMFEDVSEFLKTDCSDRDYYLVGYNAEVWKGGFDFSFLRTRYARQGLDWPFTLPYVDLLPLFSDRVNTQVEAGMEVTDLDSVYETLLDGDHCDPLDDSAEAVSVWERGNFADLLCHNIADIGRTQELAEYAEQYVPQTDFQMKNLEPPGV